MHHILASVRKAETTTGSFWKAVNDLWINEDQKPRAAGLHGRCRVKMWKLNKFFLFKERVIFLVKWKILLSVISQLKNIKYN